MRVDLFRVTSVECEPECIPATGASGMGVFRLCGDGDAFGFCPRGCVAIQTIVSGKVVPNLDVRACD